MTQVHLRFVADSQAEILAALSTLQVTGQARLAWRPLRQGRRREYIQYGLLELPTTTPQAGQPSPLPRWS